jgi:peroxiredoxin
MCRHTAPVVLVLLLLLVACGETPVPATVVPTAASTLVPMPTMPPGAEPQDMLLEVGTPAPGFSLTSADGETISLDDYAGRPLVLVFFSPYCTACQAELPELQSLAAAYEEQGLVVLGITRSEGDVMRAFARDFGLDLPILLDLSAVVNVAYHVYVVPTTYFVDRDGIIRSAVVGAPQDYVRVFFEEQLQQILPDE